MRAGPAAELLGILIDGGSGIKVRHNVIEELTGGTGATGIGGRVGGMGGAVTAIRLNGCQEACRVEDNRISSVRGGAGGGAGDNPGTGGASVGIDIVHSDGALVSRNQIWDLIGGAEGDDIGVPNFNSGSGDMRGIQVWESGGVVLTANVVHDLRAPEALGRRGSSIGINLVGAENLRSVGDLIYGLDGFVAFGFELTRADADSPVAFGIAVIHTTVHGLTADSSARGVVVRDRATIDVSNSIFSGIDGVGIYNAPTNRAEDVVVEYTDLAMEVQIDGAVQAEVGIIGDEPLSVAPGDDNFALHGASPCIDAGRPGDPCANESRPDEPPDDWVCIPDLGHTGNTPDGGYRRDD